MAIRFDETTHKYYNEDGKELISVTTLLKKHNLSPNYGDVPADILERAASRGTLVHKEIDEYIKHGTMGFTKELESFIAEAKRRGLEFIKNEYIVYNDLVAGTVDLLAKDPKKGLVLIDYKTTYTVYKNSVMWQENIYADLGEDKVDALETWHFKSDGSLETLDTPFIKTEEIDRLYACEANGEIYHYELVGYEGEIATLEDIEEELALFETQRKEKEAKAKVIREKIMNAMIENNIKTYESSRLKFTVRDGARRTTIDTEKIFKDNPNIHKEDYSVVSVGKPSLSITVKVKKDLIENK